MTPNSSPLLAICASFAGLSAQLSQAEVTPRCDTRGFKGALVSSPVEVPVIILTKAFPEASLGLTKEQQQELFKAGAERISFGPDSIQIVITNDNTLDI
jgi:hypothetical protein